ncbi:MAG: FtsX-like permease family protein [Acidimicrobiales bacterium]
MSILAALAGVLLLPVVIDLLTNGRFRRLAIRNITRRKGEAVLIVAGSLLGTAIITASFVIGDTLASSVRDVARTHLGPTDETVTVEGLDRVDELQAAVLSTPIDGSDGSLLQLSSGAAVASVGDDRRAEPDYGISEINFDDARAFGADAAITGLAGAGPTPSGDEAVINERLAEKLEISEGDEVEVFAYGTGRTFRVRDVVPELGLAGDAVLVPPGTIEAMVSRAEPGTARPPNASILVSNDGGVFDGADASDAVVDQLDARVANLTNVEVEPVKQDLLDDAESESESITTLFGAIGLFSVIAGILLLVNLFVMLAEERKTELGMMRAVGMKRNHLMRGFAAEGAVYATLAAIAGALFGIAVGWVMVLVTGRIIGADDPDFAFRFAVEPTSLMLGALIGLVIAMVTAWLTSARISSLNVIRAIRDLPEPKAERTRLRTLIFSVVGMLVGGAVFAAGLGGSDIAALVGLPMALFSAIPLVRRLLPRRVAVVTLSVAALVWGVVAFSVLPEVFKGSDMMVFVFQGIVLVAAAVAITSQVDHLWVGLADRLSTAGRGLSTRLGLAYPLDRKFRTGMLLGMYAIVIFTMTFMSVFNHLFAEQGPTLTNDLRAGYDLFIDSNPANPVPTDELENQPGVAEVATLVQAFPDFTASYESDPTPWALTGYDEELMDNGSPTLLDRQDRFATDEDTYRAVLDDPSLALVGESFLQGEGPPSDVVDVGDEITVIHPASGEERTLTIAGLTDDWLFNGVMVSDGFATEFLGDQVVPSRHYVSVDGANAEQVASDLTGALIANGADAESFAEHVDGELAETQGFIRLLQGYLALGLLIGIAGLGVVMVRAVRDRRRQVGMLRAMGFSAAVVRRAFLLEAAFIAVQGIVIGIGLGLLTAWNVVTNSTIFGEMELAFSVPWAQIALILAVPLVASLVASVAPAARAAQIRPAVALRIAD